MISSLIPPCTWSVKWGKDISKTDEKDSVGHTYERISRVEIRRASCSQCLERPSKAEMKRATKRFAASSKEFFILFNYSEENISTELMVSWIKSWFTGKLWKCADIYPGRCQGSLLSIDNSLLVMRRPFLGFVQSGEFHKGNGIVWVFNWLFFFFTFTKYFADLREKVLCKQLCCLHFKLAVGIALAPICQINHCHPAISLDPQKDVCGPLTLLGLVKWPVAKT